MLTCFANAGFDDWFLQEQNDLFEDLDIMDVPVEFFPQAVRIMKQILGEYFVEKIQTWYNDTGRNDIFENLDILNPRERNEVLRMSCRLCRDWFREKYGDDYFQGW